MFFNLSLQITLIYRINRYLSNKKIIRIFVAPLTYFQALISSCHIHPQAIIGRKIRFPHPTGIVIGAGVIINDDVTIFQQVTIGSHGKGEGEKNYPTIGNGVVVYAGSLIIGGIIVGERAVIGANSVVTIDVPMETIAVGSPATIKARSHVKS